MLVKANHPLADMPLTKVLPILEPIGWCIPENNPLDAFNQGMATSMVDKSLKDETDKKITGDINEQMTKSYGADEFLRLGSKDDVSQSLLGQKADNEAGSEKKMGVSSLQANLQTIIKTKLMKHSDIIEQLRKEQKQRDDQEDDSGTDDDKEFFKQE